MILTGTPITNSVLDMYAQFEFLGKGFSGFYKWKNFKKFYGKYRKDEAGFDKLYAVQRMPFMKHRLAKLSYTVTKKEALPDLPDKVYDIHEVAMSEQQEKAYNDLCDHLITLIESDFAKGGSTAVTAEHVLKRMLKLAEITSGFLKVAPEYSPEGIEITPAHIVEFDRNPKLEALIEILKDKTMNEKVIVWACFVHDVEAIVSRLQNESIRAVNYYGKTSATQRELAVQTFNCDPTIKVFVGNPAACSTGINLLGFDPEQPNDYATNADHAIIYSQNWQPTNRWQCEDRNHRLGIRTKIRYTDLCVLGTIDEEIRYRVFKKKLSAMQITKDVKEIVKRVLQHA
jgi:SNF2 family DNA or RNA helicase